MHGAGGIIDLQAEVRAQLLQSALCLDESRGSLGVEIGLAQVAIEHTAGEIVGAGIHQRHMYGGVGILNVHIARLCQLLRGGAQRLAFGLRLNAGCLAFWLHL